VWRVTSEEREEEKRNAQRRTPRARYRMSNDEGKMHGDFRPFGDFNDDDNTLSQR